MSTTKTNQPRLRYNYEEFIVYQFVGHDAISAHITQTLYLGNVELKIHYKLNIKWVGLSCETDAGLFE